MEFMIKIVLAEYKYSLATAIIRQWILYTLAALAWSHIFCTTNLNLIYHHDYIIIACLF